MKTTYSPIATALLLSLFGMGSAQAQSKVDTSDDMAPLKNLKARRV
ncbi:hypothetical protein PULV_a4272 [Pseudoalteromonas ulvae UL12]|nr:hypothetical protein [Pseudoalteromonas ulvae]MBE0361866.1 hypothetical protein [Pseudoalteromonas ulvae UL12]